jgi:hypothetical protein
MDSASQLCIHFMHFVQGANKVNKTSLYNCEMCKELTISDADAIYTLLNSICRTKCSLIPRQRDTGNYF